MKSKWVVVVVFKFPKLKTHLAPCEKPYALSSRGTRITSKTSSSSSSSSTSSLNHVDISALLSLAGRQGRHIHLGSSVHASIIKNPQLYIPHQHPGSKDALVVWNSLLALYSKCGALVDAGKLFDDMPLRDIISWNTIISGFLNNNNNNNGRELRVGFGLFKQMQERSLCSRFDKATLTTVLSACDQPELRNVQKMIHCLVFRCGFEREVTVGNALITSCFKCRRFAAGRRIFDEMLERSVVTWTAVISGLSQNGFHTDGLKLFLEMNHQSAEANTLTYSSSLMACSGLKALCGGSQIHALVLKLGMQGDLCVESALMDMYSKCGNIEDAWKIFECAEQLDGVAMTVILTGFAQNGFEEEAVQIFVRVVKEGYHIDPNMVSAVLGVLGSGNSLGLGKQIHSLAIKRRFGSNIFVNNGLINMYSKSGNLVDAMRIFQRMSKRNSVSWNSVITAFARHGDGCQILQLYEEMRREGVEPTDVTFLSLLHACSHAGLVDKGMELFKSMMDFHKINPRAEHYACVIDMLGRAGLLSEARSFIEEIPVKHDAFIWEALLGACSIHGATELGKYAAEQLILLSPGRPAPYVQLANIFSSEGKWGEKAQSFERMQEMGVPRDQGMSRIETHK